MLFQSRPAVFLISLALAASAFATSHDCMDHDDIIKAAQAAILVIPGAVVSVAPSSPLSTSFIAALPVASAAPVAVPKIVSVPKITAPTVATLADGAAAVVQQFQNSSYLDGQVGGKLKQALGQAISQQLSNGAVSTVTLTKTKTQTLSPTGSVPSVHYITITDVVTSTITAQSAEGSALSAAALNVKTAIDNAFAAVNLTQMGLDNTTVAALETCLTTVLSTGGMPSGYACLTSTGSNSAGLTTTLNTVLEQFVGILPNEILSTLFNSITPYLTSLLPASEDALVAQIQASIQSVIASLSGSSVTALEQVQACYTDAIKMQGNTSSLACFTSGAEKSLQTAMASVVQQFEGVLPASLMTTVQGIISSNINNATNMTSSQALAAQVQAQISAALNSAASTLSGNTVTLAEELQACAVELITTGNATAAAQCLQTSSAPVVSQTIIDGIAEQYQGYLPSSFFSDLVAAAAPFLTNTSSNPTGASAAQIDAAFNSFFNNATSYGPAYVGCIEQVQQCVTNAISKSGSATVVCPGPVKGCALPLPTSASANATATLHATPSASAQAGTTVIKAAAQVATSSSSSMVAPTATATATKGSTSAHSSTGTKMTIMTKVANATISTTAAREKRALEMMLRHKMLRQTRALGY